MAERTGDDVAPGQLDREWQRRPGLSRALRIAVFGGPIAASFGVALLLGHLLPRANSLSTSLLWVGVILGTSVVTLLAVERATRQLLPLAALLNLSLVFPDRAPARFAVARRRGRPSDLRDSLQRAHDRGRLDDTQRLQTVIDLVLALSVHDRASRGHSERVRAFTDLLADELKLPESNRNCLRWAALLHDIGKLEVSPAILNKPARPSEEEWAALHRHPEEGARLVAPLLPWLAQWGLAVEQHHERFDGTGYPHRLRGHEIALAGRIVSVADVYEVMTAPRPYKRSMSVTAARQELVRVAGTQLDPAIVRAFLNIAVGRLWRTVGRRLRLGRAIRRTRNHTRRRGQSGPFTVSADATGLEFGFRFTAAGVCAGHAVPRSDPTDIDTIAHAHAHRGAERNALASHLLGVHQHIHVLHQLLQQQRRRLVSQLVPG